MVKNMKILGICFMASVMLMMSLLTSCQQKDLCYDHSHMVDMDIDFDWHNDPEADPASMALYFFPKGGGKPFHYEFPGHGGGSIRIEAGEYDVVSFNSDTHNISLVEENNEYSFTIMAKDNDGSTAPDNISQRSTSDLPLHEGTEDERIVMQGEDMWEAAVTGLVISRPSVEEQAAHTHRHLTLTPDKVTDTYHIIIRKIENIEGLRGLSGCISGMAGGLNVASHHATDEEVIIPFRLDFYREDAYAEATVVSFGSSISPIHGHYLEVYATMSDGNTYYYDYDVSVQIDNPTGEGHEHYIYIDILRLETGRPMTENDVEQNPEDGGNGGFSVSLDEWDDPTSVTFNM